MGIIYKLKSLKFFIINKNNYDNNLFLLKYQSF